MIFPFVARARMCDLKSEMSYRLRWLARIGQEILRVLRTADQLDDPLARIAHTNMELSLQLEMI